MSQPAAAVCVASHDRPLRLRWLLNALQEQTFADFEVVVVHDSAGPQTARLLGEHPLAADGRLRSVTLPPGPGPAAKRNLAWRTAGAPLVVFTDDDCRPPEAWLESLVAACGAHPGAIVQGPTAVDPVEEVVRLHAPHARFVQIAVVPVIWAQTCNIAYPRALLEATGGFDEQLPVAAGEDTDLALRARALGAELVGAPDAVTWHAVEPATLLARAREVWRWQHLPYLAKRHPQVRAGMPLRVFWKHAHARLALLLAGLPLVSRAPLLTLLAALPWMAESMPSYGPGPRGRLRALSELPGHAVIDAVELAALARGSVRHRSLLL